MKNNSYIDFVEKSRNYLNKVVFEQRIAVEEVVYALYEKTKENKEDLSPKEVLFFIGGPSCGKRHLAQEIAKYDKSYQHFISIDMSRFAENESKDDLFGVMVDESGKETKYGELYKIAKENPKSVVVFDSIEKASLKVQSLLGKILREPDNFDISFKDMLIVFTTTMGEEFYKKSIFLEHYKNDPIKAKAWIVELLSTKTIAKDNITRELFDAEILALAMHHHVVPFVELSLKVLAEIGADSIKALAPLFSKKLNTQLKIKSPKTIATLITISRFPYINAKEAKNKVPESLFYQISKFVKEKKIIPKTITIDMGETAKKFYEKNKYILNSHVSDTRSRLQSAYLTWKDEWINEDMMMILENVEFQKTLNNKLYEYGQKPRIRTSEISFDDIAGQKQVKTALKEIIALLGKSEMIEKFKITMPKGIVLFGPEGVGKATLAEAFCKEANLPYVLVSTAELFNQSYIKHVYQVAKDNSPIVVILQDIDMQGVVEGVLTNVPSEPIVESFDSFSKNEMVFTIATANNEANINSELTKSGRIDLRVEVPELDKEARRFYIEQILKKPNDGNINIDRVVKYISGMSRDELERLDREVAIQAIKRNLKTISEELIIEQINIIKYGQKLDQKKVKNFEEELKMTAYHEAGHAVLSHILLPDIKIEQVTITPRSDALGFVSYSTEDYESNVTKEELFNNVCVLLAGRVAKIRQFGEIKGLDSGAMSDLEQATMQVYLAIAMLGMDEELGMISLGGLDAGVLNIFGKKIEERIQDWLSRAKTKTEILINQHWDKIEALAKKLIDNEVVEGEELEEIIGKSK